MMLMLHAGKKLEDCKNLLDDNTHVLCKPNGWLIIKKNSALRKFALVHICQ